MYMNLILLVLGCMDEIIIYTHHDRAQHGTAYWIVAITAWVGTAVLARMSHHWNFRRGIQWLLFSTE